MKNLFLLIFLFPLAVFSAPTLQWDASTGAEGYNVYCGETPITTAAPVDVGNVTTYDLFGSVINGVEYECWVTAYSTTLGVESADSNHIQFAPPQIVQTLVVPGQPSSVTVSWE